MIFLKGKKETEITEDENIPKVTPSKRRDSNDNSTEDASLKKKKKKKHSVENKKATESKNQTKDHHCLTMLTKEIHQQILPQHQHQTE